MIIIVNLGDHTHAAKGQMKTRLGDKRAKQRRGHGAKAPVTCRASVARSSNKEKLDAGEESGLLRCPRVLARNPFTGGRRYDGSLRVRSSMHSTLPMTLFFMTTVLLCAANDWTLGRVTSHAPNTANVTERLDIIEIQKRITQIVIVVEDDCPVSFQADEELEKRCISLWKHHHVEESIKTKQANDDGCGVFPIFRKESRGLKYKAAYSAAFRRVVPLLQQAGWGDVVTVQKQQHDAGEVLARADVIICATSAYKIIKQVAKTGAKFLLTASKDAATIPPNSHLEEDAVIAYLQHTGFRDLNENNEHLIGTRRHVAWLQDEAGIKTRESPTKRSSKISPEGLAKVHTMIPQIQRWRYPLDCGGGHGEFVQFAKSGFHNVSNRSFAHALADRPIDIAFAGAVHSQGRDDMGVGEHRAQAIAAIEHLGRKNKLTYVVVSHDLSFETYIKLLRNTKVFVSPFGIGEFSGKDYEIIMAGGLLIKPLADRLVSFPNIYNKNYSISTGADFSDLEERVMPFLQDRAGLARAQSIVDSARELLLRYSTKEIFAARLDELLTRLLIRA